MWFRYGSRSVRVVTEAVLAHVVQNKLEAAYARSDQFERRRRAMVSLPARAGWPGSGDFTRWLTRTRAVPSSKR